MMRNRKAEKDKKLETEDVSYDIKTRLVRNKVVMEFSLSLVMEFSLTLTR